MKDTLVHLMERSLLEVFSERDSFRRRNAIDNVYADDCTFFEEDEEIVGREALNAKVDSILQKLPAHFVFRPIGPVELNHDVGRLGWHLGPASGPPVATGMDFAWFKNGRIQLLYVFLDKAIGK